MEERLGRFSAKDSGVLIQKTPAVIKPSGKLGVMIKTFGECRPAPTRNLQPVEVKADLWPEAAPKSPSLA